MLATHTSMSHQPIALPVDPQTSETITTRFGEITVNHDGRCALVNCGIELFGRLDVVRVAFRQKQTRQDSGNR